MYCVYFPNGLTRFRSTSVKPYFRPETTYDVELDKLKVPLPTLEVPQKPTELAVKRGRGRPWKHPVTENTVTENYLISAGISASSTGISARQSPYADILVLVQETPFMDLQCKEINGLLKKGVFMVIAERDVLYGVHIFNSRFINEIKHSSTDKAFKKLRLVI